MSDNLEDYDLSGIGIDIDEEYIKFCNETFPKGGREVESSGRASIFQVHAIITSLSLELRIEK